MKLVGLGVLIFCLILLSACQPFRAMEEQSTMDDVRKPLDFTITMPEFVSGLSEQDFDVKYYITHTLKQAKMPQVISGYLIELHSMYHEKTGYRVLELGGADIERVKDGIEPYVSVLNTGSFTQIKEETTVPFNSKELLYSEYRTYPYNNKELFEQKNMKEAPNSLSPELDALVFDTFYAYIVMENVRYSITLYGLSDESPEVLEERCLQIVNDTFQKYLD